MAKTPKKRGFFISFEGGEGAGKSTQIILLARHLEQKGMVVVTREPGGTRGAEMVRYALLSGGAEKYGIVMEAMLFAAARADHVDRIIKPALEQGQFVLCDRFIDSGRVYQSRAGEEDIEALPRSYLDLLERAAVQDTVPDLTFILDLPADEGLKRARERRMVGERADRFEKENSAIHEARRQAFLDIARQEPQRCVVIDAKGASNEIAAEIARITDERMMKRDCHG